MFATGLNKSHGSVKWLFCGLALDLLPVEHDLVTYRLLQKNLETNEKYPQADIGRDTRASQTSGYSSYLDIEREIKFCLGDRHWEGHITFCQNVKNG